MAETTELKKSDFYFDLPQELIAQDYLALWDSYGFAPPPPARP